MKTYFENNLQYWYDWNIQMWTLLHVDSEQNQIGYAEYYANKQQLKTNYPSLKFKTNSRAI